MNEDESPGSQRQTAGKEFESLKVDVGSDSPFDPLNVAPVTLTALCPEAQPLSSFGSDLGRQVSNEVPRKVGSSEDSFL